MKRFLTLLLICAYFVTSAQNNRALYNELDITVPYTTIERFNINLQNYENLKRLGVDFQRFPPSDYKSHILYTDEVVLGKVISKKYDVSPNSLFHTIFTLEVSESFKKNNGKSTINVYMRGGALGEDMYMLTPHEPELFVGESVILLLEEVNIENCKIGLSERGVINVSNEVDNDYIISKKLLVNEDLVFSDDFLGKLPSISEKLRTIISLTKN